MRANTNYIMLDREALRHTGNTFEFEGIQYSDTDVSFVWVDMPPGDGVRLHQHPYPEIFIIQEGLVTFTISSAKCEAHAGQIILVPANTPHKFKNTGERQLRQVDIHVSRQFITQWLED